MDPNEISFNKDQFGNMFKKDSESERSLVSDRRREILDSNALYGIPSSSNETQQRQF